MRSQKRPPIPPQLAPARGLLESQIGCQKKLVSKPICERLNRGSFYAGCALRGGLASGRGDGRARRRTACLYGQTRLVLSPPLLEVCTATGRAASGTPAALPP